MWRRSILTTFSPDSLQLCIFLCPFLPTSSDELPIFYHHPRYHRGSIYCLAWLGDSLLASGSNDQTIKLLSHNPASPSPCSPCGQLNIHNGTVRELVFLPSGQLLSGGAGDSLLKISDCNTGRLVGSLEGHMDQVLSMTVVSNTVIASGSQDRSVKLWDTRHQKCFHTVNLLRPVTSMSAYNNHLAVSQVDGSVSLYDLQSLKPSGMVHLHTDECRSVRYSHNGQWLLTGSYDRTVCLVNTSTLQWKEVGQHEDKVIQCRWHGSGRVLASSGADRCAHFWVLQ